MQTCRAKVTFYSYNLKWFFNRKTITKSDPIQVILVHRIADPEPHVFWLAGYGSWCSNCNPISKKGQFQIYSKVFLFFTHFSRFYKYAIKIIIHNSKNTTFWAFRTGSKFVLKMLDPGSHKLSADPRPCRPPVLGIRDIFVLRSADPTPWLMDAEPDQIPRPTSFFRGFKDAKKKKKSHFFF